jgi:hypothetical protein
MNDQFGAREQVCILDGDAHCDRVWVSQSDGLRLAHFQTLAHEEPKNAEGASVAVGRQQMNDSAAYALCARGCLGPR